VATITKITSDAALITLNLGQLLERCKRLCGREAGTFQNPVYIEWVDQVMGELFGDARQKWIEAESQFETEAPFEDGLATFTTGSTTVTFTGAVLPTDIADFPGKKIVRNGDKTGYEIIDRVSDTELEMKFAYMPEDDAPDVTYKIVKDTFVLQSDMESLKLADQHFTNLNMLLVRNLPVQFRIERNPQLAELNKDKTITIYPAPNRILHITYEYFRLFSLRSSDLSVITQLPDMWAQHLCYGVARNFWLTQESRVGMGMAKQFSDLFREGKLAIRMDKYKFDGELVQFRPYRQPGVSSLQTGIDQQILAQDLLAQ